VQPTKYPSQVDSALSSAIRSGVVALGVGDSRTCDTREAGGMGARSALDWIEGHLTDTSYRPAEHAGRLLDKWAVPAEWSGVPSDGSISFVLSLQRFNKGGYEATVRGLDLEKIGNALEPDRRYGSREVPEELDPLNIERAACRAKRKVRYLTRNMQADHLVTFTRCEGPNTFTWTDDQWAAWAGGGSQEWQDDNAAFWTEEQWLAAWDRMRRLLVRQIGHFPYVAILERHKKGNFHLHVAWCGKANVKLLRRMWLSILGGRGAGNVDAKWMKVPAGQDRACRIARYISKYVTKSFEDNPRFNKKRYWASKQTLEDVHRYVLRAKELDGAFEEVKRLLGLDLSKFFTIERGELRMRNIFQFPDGGGVWINFIPEIHGGDPPF
jgi:hypothetical protein